MWVIAVAFVVAIVFFAGIAYLMQAAIDDSYDIGGWDYSDDDDEHGRL